MNKNIGIVVGVVVIAAIGVFAFSGNKTENKEVLSGVEEVANATQTPAVAVGENPAVVSSGSYESYSAEKIARAEGGKVVLFFHASWCPSCRGLNADIEKNAGAIPAGTTILKTDYDKETELKKKYGITTQHSLVQVDKDGNMLKKWSGGGTLENLLSQIN